MYQFSNLESTQINQFDYRGFIQVESYNGRKKHLNKVLHRDYFVVGECLRFLFTSCKGSLNERVSAANE